MTESPYDELILKLLSQEISSEEKQELMLWANENPAHKIHLQEMKKVWELSGKTALNKDFRTDAEWEKFDLLLDKEQGPKEVVLPLSRSRTFAVPMFFKVAASLLLIFLLGIAFYQLNQQELIVRESDSKAIRFSLPDGTSVWLNQHSKLEFPEEFGGSTRMVTLVGEAFFDVRKNPDQPFVIVTDDASVRVLGTSFNVDAYKEKRKVIVSVQTGTVELSAKGDESIVLIAGTTGLLDKTDQSLTKVDQPDENALAWKTRKLRFNKSNMERVFDDLRNYYHVKIEVRNPEILNCRFTGSFNFATVQEVMETLSISLNLNISQEGKVYVIDGEGCN